MPQPSIFISGAAHGIGREIAQLFAARDWFVGIADVDSEAVADLVADLGAGCALGITLDVCDPDSWQQALTRFWEHTGRLDALVNNAGILASGDFARIPLGSQLKMVDVNVKGVLTGCYTALPYLRKTTPVRQGTQPCVLNLASASALYGQPSLATYSATKFAVRGLTEALNLEWESLGIRVVDVMPLFVQTRMVDGMDAQSIKKLGVKLTPADVAAAIWEVITGTHPVRQVHWPVGLNTRVFYRLSGWMPARVNRAVNRWIGISRGG